MSTVETRNSMQRKAIHERDAQAWRATFAAAQRVQAYYASRAEVGATRRLEADPSSATSRQLPPALRLAA